MRRHRRHGISSRRPAPAQRGRFGRIKTLELLERREMLAGDVPSAPAWQNQLNRYDVSGDMRISPFDALLVINDLMANGPRSLDQVALPQSANGDKPRINFVDVSGDNRVSPFDLLLVVNQLIGEKLVEIHTYATDLLGASIDSINVGQQYRIQTDVIDLRPAPTVRGVFSAWNDASYDPALSTVDPAQVVEFGSYFTVLRTADLTTPGLIAAAGGTSITGDPPGVLPQKLWSVLATATGAGTQLIMPSFDDTVSHDVLPLGALAILTEAEINFVGDSLTIIGTPGLSIGDRVLNEGNAGTTNFIFTVTLSGALSDAVTVQFATGGGTATAGNDYTATSGTLTFSAGVTQQLITVAVNGDTVVENDETFTVSLSNPSAGVDLLVPQGVGLIVNDDALPSLSIADVIVTNDPVQDQVVHFTVSLSADPGQQVLVAFATADLTAIAGSDYTATSGTLTFNPGGGLTQVIPVTILADPEVDGVDQFVVNLSNPVNATISDNQALGTINPAVTAPSVSIADVRRAEGTGGTTPFVFTVTLSGPANQQALVSYATADGTAVAPGDYVAQSGTLTFAPGQTTATITVPVVGDAIEEPIETFHVNIQAQSVVVGSAQATGTIDDDDGPPTLEIDDATVAAGVLGTSVDVTVSIRGAVTQPITVGYATLDGSAQAGVDYLAQTGNLTFLPGGDTFRVITIPILGSTSPQPDSVFFVNLSSVTGGAIIGDNQAIVTVVTQGITISDATVFEGAAGGAPTPAVFIVGLSTAFDFPVTVAFATADGSATVADGDYTPTSGTLTFAPGVTQQTITVLVHGDDQPEPNETFALNLSNAVGATIFVGNATGTIVNDDGKRVGVRAEVADLSGIALPGNETLDVGDEFFVQVFVRDVQADPAGVLAAYVDLVYQAGLVEIVGNVEFGAAFPQLQSSGFDLGGLLDEVGAFGDINAPPANPAAEQLLFRLRFKAIDVGLANFSVATDEGEDDVFLYFDDALVVPSDIAFEGDSANIGTNVFTVSSDTKPESQNLVFTIERFLPTNTTATVSFRTVDGTAIAGQDYLPLSGTLTFLPGGPNTQTITVQVINDAIDEPDESFQVVLFDSVGAERSSAPGIGTIVDDDGAPALSIGTAAALEGEGLVFTVGLSSVSGKTVTVAYNTVDGSATAPGDYSTTGGTLTFAPGVTQQTVTVQSLADIVLESNENFRVVLSNPVNAELSTTVGQGVGTIIDVPPAGLSGFVYVDVNDNGIKDVGETGIAGVLITVTSNTGFTTSTLTGEDGSYVFVGLIPGTYTITETQPGFFVDGKDARLGVQSPVNDQFSGIVLEPSAALTGFNFGEKGIRGDFISAFLNRRALFATAVVTGHYGGSIGTVGVPLNVTGGDVWISFDAGWTGLQTLQALFDSSLGNITMKLYDNALNLVALSVSNALGAELTHLGTGGPYFLRISGNNPSVQLLLVESTPLVAQTSSATTNQQPPADPTKPPVNGRFASAAVMTEPQSEPLVSSEAADEAFDETSDWTVELLLS